MDLSSIQIQITFENPWYEGVQCHGQMSIGSAGAVWDWTHVWHSVSDVSHHLLDYCLQLMLIGIIFACRYVALFIFPITLIKGYSWTKLLIFQIMYSESQEQQGQFTSILNYPGLQVCSTVVISVDHT